MTITEITPNHREQIARRLTELELVHGIGDLDAHEACTIAAINLALTGELVDDDRANCISPVIRSWVIPTQDAMPVDMLNTVEWRTLIPWIAGTRTTDNHIERLRAQLVFGWMLDRLQYIRPDATETWCEPWDKMITAGRTYLGAAWAAWAAEAARAARAAEAAGAAWAARAAEAAALEKFWTDADPVKLLRQLIDAGTPAAATP